LSIRYEYGVVKRALASLYGLNETQQEGPFQARLINLQRLGVVGLRPGRGQAIAYGPPEMERLVFAMELSEAGLTPATIATVIEAQWHRVGQIFRAAQKTAMEDAGDDDIVLTVGAPRFTTGPWLAPDKPALPAINSCTIGRFGAQAQMLTNAMPRFLAINLSAQLRRFHAALIVASRGGRDVLLDGEEVPTEEERALAALRDQIDPLRKKFATAGGLTSEESRQLGLLLQREARLRDKTAKPRRSTKGSRRRGQN
jgi:hypothetical protein